MMNGDEEVQRDYETLRRVYEEGGFREKMEKGEWTREVLMGRTY